MSKQITINIEDTMCISREWLEGQEQVTEEYLGSGVILMQEREGVRNLLSFIRIVKSQLFPAKVLVEEAWDEGSSSMMANYHTMEGVDTKQIEVEKQYFLTSTITLNIEENGNK